MIDLNDNWDFNKKQIKYQEKINKLVNERKINEAQMVWHEMQQEKRKNLIRL